MRVILPHESITKEDSALSIVVGAFQPEGQLLISVPSKAMSVQKHCNKLRAPRLNVESNQSCTG